MGTQFDGYGAEVGIYTNPHDLLGVEQWDCIDFELPMSIQLFKSGTSVFYWKPNTEQWWATGFNPEYVKAVERNDPNAMKVISTIDFSKNSTTKQIFTKLKALPASTLGGYWMFDDSSYTAFFLWS